MKKTSLFICLVLLSVAIVLPACGGDDNDEENTNLGSSGVDRTKLLSDLTNEERDQFCDWKHHLLVDEYQEQGCAETAEDEITFSETLVSSCADDDDNFPECSLSLLEDCVLAIVVDICSGEVPEVCTQMKTCFDENNPPENRNPVDCPPCAGYECSDAGWCFF